MTTDHTPDETPTGPTAGNRHQWLTLEQGDVSISVQSGGLLAQWREVHCVCGLALTADYANALEQQVATLTEDRDEWQDGFQRLEAEIVGAWEQRDAAREQAQEAQAAVQVLGRELTHARPLASAALQNLDMETIEEYSLLPIESIVADLPAATKAAIDRTARLEAFLAAEQEYREARKASDENPAGVAWRLERAIMQRREAWEAVGSEGGSQ